jgi:hypothetical protein
MHITDPRWKTASNKPVMRVQNLDSFKVKLTFTFEHYIEDAADARDIVRWQRDDVENTGLLGTEWAEALLKEQKYQAEREGQSEASIEAFWTEADPPKFVRFATASEKFLVMCEITPEFEDTLTPDLVKFANRAMSSKVETR